MTTRIVPQGLGVGGLRRCLEGRLLDRACLTRFGVSPRDKGKWGKANERLAGLTLSPSMEPDLEDGELKTTVRGTDGRFRESVKICMTGHSPMKKLEHIYLVVARDQNGSREFEQRVVRNEQVVSLRPVGRTRRALEFDELLLNDHPRANETHFLETRTAGPRDSSTRGFYIRANALEQYIAETVVTHELREVRRALRGTVISPAAIRAAGVSVAQKNATGRFIALNVGAKNLYATVRQGPVDCSGNAKEDLFICDEHEDPIQALWRTIYVSVGPRKRSRPGSTTRVVRDVVMLAPTGVVARALARDLRLLRRIRGPRADTYFLKLKPHGQRGSRKQGFYIDRRYMTRYVGLVGEHA